MGDSLERFIVNNREAFDDLEPTAEVWQKIRKKRSYKDKVVNVLWRVAAVVLLVSTVLLILERGNDQERGAQERGLTDEFSKVEDYYTSLIIHKKQEILNSKNPSLRRGFLIEIERLDEQYEKLKETYLEQNAGDMLTDAMINNLKLRIQILNKQLEILNQMNKDQENEKSYSEI